VNQAFKSRRELLKLLAVAPLLSQGVPAEAGAQASDSSEKPRLTLVSRHVQWTSMEEGAAVAAEAGFPAIAWTVRSGAHMEPANVERDLRPT